jgi:serine/threonine-protein kinase
MAASDNRPPTTPGGGSADNAGGAPPHPDPLIGTLVAERYRIEQRLGEGGIGRVYRALQLQLGRPVALKILHPELSGNKDLQARFEREARAASRLTHPGSVVVYDFGAWKDLLYIAMELVAGPSLDAILRSGAPLPPPRVVDLGAQLCDTLAAAHAQGLLHRDLKPENILIARAPDGREVAKVCDYGLAFLLDEEGRSAPRLTRDGTVAGTPAFMAPEQVMNRPLDARSDLYALGCVLYEMVCGWPVFAGDSAMEILTKQLYDEPEPPSRRTRQPIPRALERAILWALQKAPGNRPQRASELKAALLHALDAPADKSERPSADEVQRLVDRDARGRAAGLLPLPPPAPEALAAQLRDEVLVIAPADTPVERSVAFVLRAQGIAVRHAADFSVERAAGSIVVDVRGDPRGGVERLSEALVREPRLALAALLVVGPDDDFVAMTRALELQSAEYIPESLLPSLPRKLQRALERKRRSRG